MLGNDAQLIAAMLEACKKVLARQGIAWQYFPEEKDALEKAIEKAERRLVRDAITHTEEGE